MSEVITLSSPLISGNAWKYIKECLDTSWVSSGGEYVRKFEKAISEYTKAKYAISCINATSGLFIALKILDIKPNQEVLVPTLTFIAPVNAIKYIGAEPVFMDCDNYMNIDVEKLQDFCNKECKMTKQGLKNKISTRIIKAILPVHIFGNPCDMEGVMSIARKYELKVIEDAAEALGGYYTSTRYKGKFLGTIADVGIYSFNGNKIITSGGGGIIVTNNKKLADKAMYLTTQAKDDPLNYIHNEVGYNFRLSNLQAALGLSQLEQINRFIQIKKNNYYLYKEKLQSTPGIKLLEPPAGIRVNYWFYPLIIDKDKYGLDREGLRKELFKRGILSRPIWKPNHLQKPYLKNQHYKIKKAIYFWERVLNIPCSVNLSKKDIFKITNIINFLSKKCKI